MISLFTNAKCSQMPSLPQIQKIYNRDMELDGKTLHLIGL